MMYHLNDTELDAIDQWSAIVRELHERTSQDGRVAIPIAAALIQQTLQVTALRQAEHDARAAIINMGQK